MATKFVSNDFGYRRNVKSAQKRTDSIKAGARARGEQKPTPAEVKVAVEGPNASRLQSILKVKSMILGAHDRPAPKSS